MATTGVTAQEAIQGMALDVILNGLVSGKRDSVTLLSETNQTETNLLTHKQFVGKDGNVISTVDKYGDVTADADLAELADRTFGEHVWDFPEEERIVLKISHERMDEYGISNSMLYNKLSTDADFTNFNAKTGKLDSEVKKLLAKVKTFRRKQVTDLLANLDVIANLEDWQKPMGYAIVDSASNRPDYFNYNNKLSASALDKDEFALAVDILASSQKNIMNEDYEMDTAQMLLHASSITLAEEIFAPNLAVNVNERRAGDSLDSSEARYVGVFKDSVSTADWIILGYNHAIRRMNWKGGDAVNGITVELHPASGRTYGVELVCIIRSIMVCDSTISIVKCVAP